MLPYQQQVYQQRQVLPVHPAPIHSVHQVAHHVGADAAAPILKSVSDIHPDGQYVVEYETGNGIVAKESGLAGKSVQGSYAYTSPEGTPISLTYVADENGKITSISHNSVNDSTLGTQFQINRFFLSLLTDFSRLPTNWCSFASRTRDPCSCIARFGMDRCPPTTRRQIRWTLRSTSSTNHPSRQTSNIHPIPFQQTILNSVEPN